MTWWCINQSTNDVEQDFSSLPFRRRRFVAAVSSLIHFGAIHFVPGDTSSPSIPSRGHFVTIHFVAETLRRLPFRRWDASSLEQEQDCGIRLSLKTT